MSEIHGGLLNETYKIETDDGNFILKRHLENPKVLATGKIPGNRYPIEKSAYELLEKISPRLTPQLMCSNDEHEVLIFEYLDNSRRLDKVIDSIDSGVFYNIGKAIADIVNKTHGKTELLPKFDNNPFQEFKYEHKYYETSKDFPELHKVRDEVMHVTRTERTALVLGDIRLTNVFVFEDGSFKFIDFEGAHFCEPSQDIAYFIGELVVRYLNEPTEQIKKNILMAWRGYSEFLKFGNKRTEYLVTKEIGFHLLDQVTGHIKSDYAFVKDPQRLVDIAKDIILKRETIVEIVK
jgi:5-methylthioribose kinase